MSTDVAAATPAHALSKSRGWLIFAGILSIFVGFMAMGSPYLFSAFIVIFLGAFALVSGCGALALALFGHHKGHRVLEAVLALIRIAAGIVLLTCVKSGIEVITLILAIFLVLEGVHSVVGAIQMRAHQGWIWMLISGVAAIVLGLMVWERWPSGSWAILGLLYGINSIFWGASTLALGMGTPKPAAA